MKNYIREYFDKIQSGEVVAGKRLVQQYTQIIEELDNPKDPWVFDIEKATHPITFIEHFCKLSVGRTGTPVRLDLWQKAFVQAAFGFVHKDTGNRRVRELFMLIGRKNGKTSLLAWLSLYLLIADQEGGAEIYFLATKRDQARKGFVEVSNVVSQSPYLSKHIRKRKTDIYFPVTFSKVEPLASESHSLDGLNSHGVIIDELHAIKDRNLYDVMRQSMSSREQPMLVMISTAGFVRECIFDDIYDYACRVLDGVVKDDRFLAFMYELDDREEWFKPKCWQKANPGLGTIKQLEDMKANVERAKHDSHFLPTVLTKDFNIRETTAGAWLTFEEANNEGTYNLEEYSGTYGIGGVDLSATTDLTSAGMLVVHPETGEMIWETMSWMPEATIKERTKQDKVPYDRWVERGLITLCPGHKIDYTMVTNWFLEIREQYNIIGYWVGYDSWMSQAWIEDMETRLGYKNRSSLVPVIMGAKTLSGPMKLLKADLAEKNINYDNNPLMKWALTNVGVEVDKNENIRPVKGNSQKARIDPAVALLIAYTVYQNNRADFAALIEG